MDKLADLHRGGGGDAQSLQLVGIDLDIFVLRIFETLHDVLGGDPAALVHVLMVDAMMGLAVDLMELDGARRLARRVDADGDGDEGNLNRAGPNGACRHELPPGGKTKPEAAEVALTGPQMRTWLVADRWSPIRRRRSGWMPLSRLLSVICIFLDWQPRGPAPGLKQRSSPERRVEFGFSDRFDARVWHGETEPRIEADSLCPKRLQQRMRDRYHGLITGGIAIRANDRFGRVRPATSDSLAASPHRYPGCGAVRKRKRHPDPRCGGAGVH